MIGDETRASLRKMWAAWKPTPILWPVAINVPREDGSVLRLCFRARFMLLGTTDGAALYARYGTLAAIVREHLVGWEGMTGENGADIPFSAELRDRLLNNLEILRGLWCALIDASRKCDLQRTDEVLN